MAELLGRNENRTLLFEMRRRIWFTRRIGGEIGFLKVNYGFLKEMDGKKEISSRILQKTLYSWADINDHKRQAISVFS